MRAYRKQDFPVGDVRRFLEPGPIVLVLTERVRMSRVIHDTLLQGLVAVAAKLQGLMDSAGVAQDARQELSRMRREVEAYIRDARRSIWNLRSTTSEAEDLPTRLKHLAERFVETLKRATGNVTRMFAAEQGSL